MSADWNSQLRDELRRRSSHAFEPESEDEAAHVDAALETSDLGTGRGDAGDWHLFESPTTGEAVYEPVIDLDRKET